MPLEGDAKVNARAELIAALAGHACCFSDEDAERMVDAFAHQLAEQQRVAAKKEHDEDIYIDELSMGFVNKVIDGIDPEAERP